MESGSLFSLDLAHLGLHGHVDMRPTLLRVLTDLYVQKLTHTPDEERHYTELALRLLDGVDVPTRATVAARLAHHLSPPVRVIQRLAADLPDVAAPVRAHPLLQGNIEAEKLAPAVAMPVAEVEIDQQGEETAPAAEAPITIAADVASELNELFFAANANERRLILLNLEIVAPTPAGRVEFARDAAVGRRLEAAALARNREDFAQHLAQALQIPRAQARRIAGDDLGEPVVTAAKALNMSRDVVYRILLFINATIGHSVERVHALAALYDEMPPQAAEHMVAIWQALHKKERAAAPHRPLLWNDEAAPVRPRQRCGAHRRRSGRANAATFLEHGLFGPSFARRSGLREGGKPPSTFPDRRLTYDIKKIAARSVLDFDDPEVGIEFYLARKIGLDHSIRRRSLLETCREAAVGAAAGIEGALRRRPEQIRRAVEPADTHENGAGFFRAAPAHDGEGALDLTAPQISGDPKC